MPKYTISQGDTIASIAKANKLPDPDAIFHHAFNIDYKKKRPDANVCYPGDELYVPDPEEKKVSKPTGARHKFKKPKKEAELVVRLLDGAMEPRKAVAYELAVKDGSKYKGKTDADGVLRHKIAIDAKEATLKCPGACYTLKIGWLDPIEELEGVKARLQSLGFKVESVDKSDDQALKNAVKSFQQLCMQDRDAAKNDGTLDDETRAKIKKTYGC